MSRNDGSLYDRFLFMKAFPTKAARAFSNL